jgi:hypothetical protein
MAGNCRCASLTHSNPSKSPAGGWGGVIRLWVQRVKVARAGDQASRSLCAFQRSQAKKELHHKVAGAVGFHCPSVCFGSHPQGLLRAVYITVHDHLHKACWRS